MSDRERQWFETGSGSSTASASADSTASTSTSVLYESKVTVSMLPMSFPHTPFAVTVLEAASGRPFASGRAVGLARVSVPKV
jgi:hypothetical protein